MPIALTPVVDAAIRAHGHQARFGEGGSGVSVFMLDHCHLGPWSKTARHSTLQPVVQTPGVLSKQDAAELGELVGAVLERPQDTLTVID